MAIIWADFPSGQRGIYDNQGSFMLNGIWAETSGASMGTQNFLANDPDPNVGSAGIVLRMDCNATASSDPTGKESRFALPAEVTTLGLGVRLWLSKLPTVEGQCPFIAFRTNANAGILLIRISTTGQLIAYKDGALYGSSPGAEQGRSVPCLTANAYQHIEIKATKGAGTGAIIIKVNGVEKLNLSALTLSASNIAQFALGGHKNAAAGDGGMVGYWKDLVVWDTTGAYANDFQGSIAVHDLSVNADISLNWLPSTGLTGWNLIDENLPDDLDYIAALSPPPAAAVFGMTNLPPDVTSVRALLPIYRAEKTDGGDCNIQSGLTPDGATWVNGADKPMTTAFTYYWSPIHTSPVTAAPWTPAEVNAAYVRVNRTL